MIRVKNDESTMDARRQCSNDGVVMGTTLTVAVTWKSDGADDNKGPPIWMKRRR